MGALLLQETASDLRSQGLTLKTWGWTSASMQVILGIGSFAEVSVFWPIKPSYFGPP